MPRLKRKTVEEAVQEIDEHHSSPKEIEIKEQRFISTGSTLLNLALSDRVDGGYLLGAVHNLIGKSGIGKSYLALAMNAEGVQSQEFKDYIFNYRETEAAMNFPMAKMFGKAMSRVNFYPELKDRGKPITMQAWHNDLLKSTKTPVIETCDSFDGITTEEALKGEIKAKGGFQTEKPLIASALFPKIVGQICANQSILLIISQTKKNIGVMFGPQDRRAGGDALGFNSSSEIWIDKISTIYKKVRGENEKIGAYISAKVTKNKLTGKLRTISFPIYYEYGLDDTRSMIEWLIDKKFWGKEKLEKKDKTGKSKRELIQERMEEKEEKESLVIDTCGDFINGKLETLIQHIEDNNLEDKLKHIVQESWNQLENEISIKRKPRYV